MAQFILQINKVSLLVSKYICKARVKNHMCCGSQANRILSFVNVKNDRDESRMASGRLFQVRGPATANDLSPNEVYVCGTGTWSFPLSADLIPGRRSMLG